MPNQYTALPMPARFWANVDKSGPAPSHCPEIGPCWLWKAHTVRGNYGQMRFEGQQRPAHVVAWMLSNGPVSDGMFICHRCDVRQCVRPSHLFEGTNDENMADMVAKHRAAIGVRNVNAKVTEAMVSEARRRYAAGGITLQQLADWAGISRTAMHRIIQRRTWSHVI